MHFDLTFSLYIVRDEQLITIQTYHYLLKTTCTEYRLNWIRLNTTDKAFDYNIELFVVRFGLNRELSFSNTANMELE